MSEIIFLGVLALIIIGPKELPELARTLGRFLNELKRSTNVLGEELKQQARIDRIDFNEPPARNHIPHPNEKEQTPEPQQMELTDQASTEDKKEEHKPS
ncbi:twin-arginine translocase TatA/TatE family subunit [Bdellovibrio bacteriovorus]|uniref:Sec-independent protein translocase subunit TatA/TatB n=1 Tax=Bdellovibrio TaxID=958 RepID=UPI0035A8B613